ncbi:MAG: FtsQ-type POTRA domain-containing protein, partial [Verrucomicrobiae bacterium]|nr:FtsQ-type POTRA domain-containing protein [Verrucomicrobiae bacterium]
MAAVGVICMIGGISYGWSWGRQKLLDAGLFSLKTVEISTSGNWIKPEQVKQWAGIREGMNILEIDLTRVRRDLELVPQIKSASVERVLPHLLRVRVIEREPVARIQTLAVRANGVFLPATCYIDAEGVVMPAPQAGEVSAAFMQTLESLPLIRGVAQSELCPGKKIQSEWVGPVLGLLGSFGNSEVAAQVDIVAIDVSVRGLMSVVTEDGATVVLGGTGLEEQLRR